VQDDEDEDTIESISDEALEISEAGKYESISAQISGEINDIVVISTFGFTLMSDISFVVDTTMLKRRLPFVAMHRQR